MANTKNDVAVGYQAALADIAAQILSATTKQEALEKVLSWLDGNLHDRAAAALLLNNVDIY